MFKEPLNKSKNSLGRHSGVLPPGEGRDHAGRHPVTRTYLNIAALVDMAGTYVNCRAGL